jgi:hypothetical protein
MREENMKRTMILGAALSLLCLGTLLFPVPDARAQQQAHDLERVASQLVTLFRAGATVISENQKLINDPEIGDKGLSGDKVVELVKERYKKTTNQDLNKLDPATRDGKLMRILLDSVKEVVDKAQPLINRKGLGFKGFIPAVFTSQLADAFRKNTNGLADIKRTAPKAYVRNRANMPDAWEDKVIETIFKASGYEKGKTYAAMGEHKGRAAFRLIIPEYYAASCLACHGEPKGERDITGGMKEGGKLDDLGGAFSVAIYVK